MRIRAALVLAALATPAAADSLQLSVTTTTNGGNFAPKNVVAVWVEGPGATFVKTIDRWAATRKSHLVAWIATAGNADVDAVSGATRPDHATPLAITWDLKDRQNAIVPDGTYTIRMELADSNSSTAAQNHQGTFTFVKGPQGSTQTNLTNGGFTNVDITYAVTPATCGNGVVDTGETCDGNCPTTCPASADACMPNQLVGTTTECSAACVAQAITTCVNDDGCCAAGCDATTDNDCTPGGGGGGGSDTTAGGSGVVSGGCHVGGDGGVWFALGAIGLAVAQRRRRGR